MSEASERRVNKGYVDAGLGGELWRKVKVNFTHLQIEKT